MSGIEANLNDLQAGIEAGSRSADALRADAAKCDGLLNAPLLRTVVRHIKELQTCAGDQRAAMRELREGITRLQRELRRSSETVNLPSAQRDW
jgi:hypothetical protein